MSEKDEKILNAILSAIPKMTEFEKGYLMGIGEAAAVRQNEAIAKADKNHVQRSEQSQAAEPEKTPA